MTLSGNPDGLLALKQLREERKEYLKFLITEAKSNVNHQTSFKGPDGRRWKLIYHPARDEVEVQEET